MVVVFKSGVKQDVYLAELSRQSGQACASRAVSVEYLLQWAYGDQKVDRVAGHMGADIPGLNGAGADFDRLEELGVRVDGGGPVGQNIDPGALAIHDVMCAYAAASKEQAARAGLMVLYARKGCRPDVLSAEPLLTCRNLRTYSYWAGTVELEDIPSNMMRKPTGYEGPYVCKGQACDVMFVRDFETHEKMLEIWKNWAVGLEEIHARLPSLRRWRVKPFTPPNFVRRENS